MSQDVMVQLAKEVTRDLKVQPLIEDMSDEGLAEMGLEPEEIASIRSGFFNRVLRLGIFLDDRPANEQGCCFE